MRPAITLGLALLLTAAAPGLRAQTAPAAPASSKPAAKQPAKPAAPANAKPAAQQPAKPAAQQPAKPAAQSAARPAAPAAAKPVPAVKKPAKPPAARPAKPVEEAVNPDAQKEGEERAARRDPFESLVLRQQAQARAATNLPPGKAGLQVGTLRLDGVVKAPSGMIAVVSNPQSRTYFLREGDQLYDGRVEKIAMDGVSFHEIGKDAFGKPVERQVNKRIYPSAGEQQ